MCQECPQWLKDQMEAQRKLPPPSIEKVRQQFAAVSRFRKENAGCHKHKEFDCINPPETNCYYCWTAYVDKHQTEESVKLFWKAMDQYDGLQS